MTYIIYLDNCYVTDQAECVEEAKEDAKRYFIELLQRGDAQLIIQEEN